MNRVAGPGAPGDLGAHAAAPVGLGPRSDSDSAPWGILCATVGERTPRNKVVFPSPVQVWMTEREKEVVCVVCV